MQLQDIDNLGHQLDAPAAAAWLRLKAAAEAAGFTVSISTAYRSNAEQKILYSKYIHDVAFWERSGRLGARPAPVAIPGKSHHELGLCVDVHVAAEPAFLGWLRKHAAEYHFYNTVGVEIWHWEYCPDR